MNARTSDNGMHDGLDLAHEAHCDTLPAPTFSERVRAYVYAIVLTRRALPGSARRPGRALPAAPHVYRALSALAADGLIVRSGASWLPVP